MKIQKIKKSKNALKMFIISLLINNQINNFNKERKFFGETTRELIYKKFSYKVISTDGFI